MPSDADLTAYFEKNRARYAVPERRTVRYALLDMDQLRARAAVSDDEIRTYYNDHLDTYKLPDRAHVAHILFKTVGKTDAEVGGNPQEGRGRSEEGQERRRISAAWPSNIRRTPARIRAATSTGSCAAKPCRNSRRWRSACQRDHLRRGEDRSTASTSSR